MKPVTKNTDNFWVKMYSNKYWDLIDQERFGWIRIPQKTLHDLFGPYIQRWLSPTGSILRTRGASDSVWLAKKIIRRFAELVQKDIFEENDEFHIEGIGYLRAVEEYRFRPKALNRYIKSEFKLDPKIQKKLKCEYRFIADNKRREWARKKLLINGNS